MDHVRVMQINHVRVRQMKYYMAVLWPMFSTNIIFVSECSVVTNRQ